MGARVAFAITYAWVRVLVDVRKERVIDRPAEITCMG